MAPVLVIFYAVFLVTFCLKGGHVLVWNILRDWISGVGPAISARYDSLTLTRHGRWAARQLAIAPGREALPAHDHLSPEDVLWLVRRDWVPPQATVTRLQVLAAKTNAELEAARRQIQRREALDALKADRDETARELEVWRKRVAESEAKAKVRSSLGVTFGGAGLHAESERKVARALYKDYVYVAERADPVATIEHWA